MSAGVVLDFSKAQPIAQGNNGSGVTLDFSKAQPLEGQQSQGPKLSPQPSGDFTYSSDPTTGLQQRLTMPLVKGLLALHDKLRDVENMTQEGKAAHPVQGAIGDLANRIEGLLIGNPTHPEAGIGTGETGVLTNPITAAILPGSGGEPALYEGIKAGAGALKEGMAALQGGKAAEETPGLIKQVIKGGKVAQEPAQSALKTAAGAGEETQGIRTYLDKPIATLAKTERASYDTLNKAAGTDLKSLYDYRAELQDALEDPTNIANKQNLNVELNRTDMQIAQGESKAIESGLTPDALDKAKAITQKRFALEDLKKKVFNNESVVSGNVAHGAEESVNVDSAIRNAENLNKPSRYAPEGSPTRLQQALGSNGAKQLLQNLYDAKKAGESAIRVQKIAKWFGGLLGLGAGEEAIRHLAK